MLPSESGKGLAALAMNWLHRLVEAFVILLFLSMLAVGFGQIFNRFVLNMSLSWSEEFQRFAHIWLVFLAIPIGYRRSAHIGVDLMETLLPPGAARILAIIIDLFWLVLATGVIVTTLQLMQVARRQTSPGLGLTMDTVYLGLVLGAAYLAIVALGRLVPAFLGRGGAT